MPKEDITMLITYVRKSRNGDYTKSGRVLRKPERVKKGIMVAIPMEDKVRIGWALCNFTAGDKYSPEMAINIAKGRAVEGSTDAPAASMLKPLRKFIDRAARYYKDKEIECTFPLVRIQQEEPINREEITCQFEELADGKEIICQEEPINGEEVVCY
jgi:hypothetical protein